MAETQRVASPSLSPAARRTAVRPRVPHPPRHSAPLRIPLDETRSLEPPSMATRAAGAVSLIPPRPADDRPTARVDERRAGWKRPASAPRFSSRARGERLPMALLLLGVAVNGAVLLAQPGLTRADVLLATTVLAAGLLLLVLMELCRSRSRR